jgi:hypothetical protein
LTAESTLAKGIAQTVGVEGRDVRLLQRVVAKDGEGRLALAALYWSDHQKAQAETVLGDACVRLDQLYNRMDGAAVATAAETLYKYIIVRSRAFYRCALVGHRKPTI